MLIEGSVALVTGGNRGIGEGFVLELLEAGASKVYIGSRDPSNAQRLHDAYPERSEVVTLDISDDRQVLDAAERCADVTLLVNNAGIFNKQTMLGAPDMLALTEEMQVNYLGTISMCRAFAPVIESNGGGTIVNVLSAAAIVAVPTMGGYSPSKFALRAASDCLRAELAPRGVHVSSLIVGVVDTRMAAEVTDIHQEQPRDIARAGLLAVQNSIDEHDTDPFAIGIRASMARDPVGLARSLAAELSPDT